MNNLRTKVCIIVPVYKVEKYIEKCIDSLVDQTYKNIEIILVDDGSPDKCPEICDSYASKHENVIALHKKNGGLSDARNFGVQFAKSDWVAFVDSDDYVEPQYIETLVELKEKYEVDMVITRAVREMENGKGKPSHKQFEAIRINASEALYQVYTGTKVGWSAYGKLIPRDVLLKHPFPDGYYEDAACMYKIIDDLDQFDLADYESNYHYIQRDDSILCSPLNKNHLHIFEIAKEFTSFIKEEHPEMEILIPFFYRRAVTQVLNLQIMPRETYKCIFRTYRPIFRKYIKAILADKTIDKKSKIYFLFLCGSPSIYFLQRKIILLTRH